MYHYQILKLTRSGTLTLWDGPNLTAQVAKRVLKERQRKYPKAKFFIYKADCWCQQ